MILVHDHRDLGWSLQDIIALFIGLPIVYIAYGKIVTLFYLFFILNVLFRKIMGKDEKDLEELKKRLLEQHDGTH